jgi:hypothetical protein
VLKLSDRRMWGFDDAERKVLLDATTGLTELAEVVARAKRHEQIEGLWVVSATGHELDDLYSLVQALMDATRSRKRLELLEGMLATLCQSIDGF